MGGGRLALVIADVAGKGTPASLLMASVHAFVHALAGTAAPAQVIERLNRFLFARTQASRFVTLFYAELDAATRRLTYVNAGHVPPYRVAETVRSAGSSEGGPALGLLAEASLRGGRGGARAGGRGRHGHGRRDRGHVSRRPRVRGRPVCEALRRCRDGSASAILRGLVAAVNEWAGGAGFSDDLTALILRALSDECLGAPDARAGQLADHGEPGLELSAVGASSYGWWWQARSRADQAWPVRAASSASPR